MHIHKVSPILDDLTFHYIVPHTASDLEDVSPFQLISPGIVETTDAFDVIARLPRDAAELVRAQHGKGETILVIGIAHRVIDVYLADLSPQYSFMHGTDLEAKLAQVTPTWIVLYYPDNVSAANYTLLESRDYETVERFRGWADWSNGDVVVYKRKSQ